MPDRPRFRLLAWLASEGHCVNLMRPVFTHLGVGRADTFWAVAFAAPR